MCKYYHKLCTGDNDHSEKSDEHIEIWRHAQIIDSHIDTAIIGDNVYCKGSMISKKVLLNRRCFILHSQIGDATEVGLIVRFFTQILVDFVLSHGTAV